MLGKQKGVDLFPRGIRTHQEDIRKPFGLRSLPNMFQRAGPSDQGGMRQPIQPLGIQSVINQNQMHWRTGFQFLGRTLVRGDPSEFSRI